MTTGLTIVPSTEDLRGRTVVDRDGRVLGKVHDLLIDDQQHKARFLLVAHGGFLGLGEAKSFIPVDAITKITDESRFALITPVNTSPQRPHTTRASSVSAAITAASTTTTDTSRTGLPATVIPSTPGPTFQPRSDSTTKGWAGRSSRRMPWPVRPISAARVRKTRDDRAVGDVRSQADDGGPQPVVASHEPGRLEQGDRSRSRMTVCPSEDAPAGATR